MKKYGKIAIGLLVVSCITFLAMVFIGSLAIAEPLETTVSAWSVLDASTSDGTEPTALAVTERTLSTVKAAIAAASSGDDEIGIFYASSSVISKANAIRVRCIGITDNSICAWDVWTGSLAKGSDCELSLRGTLTFTVGTQASSTSTYEFADTLVLSAETASTSAWGIASPTGELVAEASLDLQGDDVLVLVPTTLGCDAKLLGKFY